MTTTYAVALVDSKTGFQVYLGKTAEERFNEPFIVFRAESLAEVAKWALKNVRGAKRYTNEGEWRDVPRRFVQVKLFQGYGERLYPHPDTIIMGNLPEWITKNA